MIVIGLKHGFILGAEIWNYNHGATYSLWTIEGRISPAMHTTLDGDGDPGFLHGDDEDCYRGRLVKEINKAELKFEVVETGIGILWDIKAITKLIPKKDWGQWNLCPGIVLK